ncbi:PIG-L deacetylase family protein, partial [Methylogaea oryzae]|uniref:PIG-L deacetylase family protein n=1 Tax=Methylogaea oryzae TaxID=1295382 RepID=UPI000A5B6FA4
GARAGVPPPLELGQGERVLVLAPHPDDETLSAAGLMHQVLQRQGSARVVIVTAGDAYVEGVERDTGKRHPHAADFLKYGETRLEEARRAVQVLGEGAVRLDLLGFSDGALYPMLVSHWRRVHPEKSEFTGFDHVPYPEAEDEGMVQDGEDLRRQLLAILRDTDPTLIVFPDVMENDSDHAALGMFALLAISDWLSMPGHPPPQPRLLAYLIHWQNHWPPGSSATGR